MHLWAMVSRSGSGRKHICQSNTACRGLKILLVLLRMAETDAHEPSAQLLVVSVHQARERSVE
jgi:hypothetical protein